MSAPTKPQDRWRCFWCGQEIEVERPLKPINCPNPNCTHRGPGQHAHFTPLTGPWTYFEDGGGKFVPKKLADKLINEVHFVSHRDSGNIYVYNEGVYEGWGKQRIEMEVRRELGDLCNEHMVSETVSAVREMTYAPPSTFSSPPPQLVCVNNGILNLLTGELAPHAPEEVFLNKIPWNWNPDAQCPKIMEFLKERLPDPTDLQTFLEACGYCLYRGYPIQVAIMLYGEGDTGKSTLLNLLRRLLGTGNVVSRSLQQLCSDRFATAELFGKLACIFPDLPSEGIYDTSVFKALTGGDLIPAQRKFGQPFYFVNYAKLLFSCNQIPQARDLSDAYFRRWVLIPCNEKVPEDKKDPYILDKICTPEEMSGFLRVCVEAFRQALARGHFLKSRTVEEIRQEYLRKADPIAYFAQTCLVENPDMCIPRRLLYQIFQGFCRELRAIPPSDVTFNRKLPEHISVSVQKVRVPNSGQVWVWIGVGLNPDVVGAIETVQVEGGRVAVVGYGSITLPSEEQASLSEKSEQPTPDNAPNVPDVPNVPIKASHLGRVAGLEDTPSGTKVGILAGTFGTNGTLEAHNIAGEGSHNIVAETPPSKVTAITQIARALQLLHGNFTEPELLEEVEKAGIERQAGAVWLQKALEEGEAFEISTGIYSFVRPPSKILSVIRLKEDLLPDLVIDVVDGQPVTVQAKKNQLIALPVAVARRLIEKGKAEEVK